MTDSSIVISYVFHGKDNLKCFKKFLYSVKKYPPAPSTILSITVKQIPDSLKLKMKNIVSEMNLQLIVKFHHFPDIGHGLGTHYIINEIYNPRIIIFMTATSQFNHKDWFSLIVSPFKDKTVGVVGSMYSLLSIKTDYYINAETRIRVKFYLKLSKIQEQNAIYRSLKQRKHYLYFGKLHTIISNFVVQFFFQFYIRKNPIGYKANFPSYPNPSLRGTGLAIRGDLLHEIGRIPISKEEELIFESGYTGISAEASRLGYKVLVCTPANKYSNIYDKELSETYTKVGSKAIVYDYHIAKFDKLSKLKQSAFNYLISLDKQSSFLDPQD
jgi:hypothetical protein